MTIKPSDKDYPEWVCYDCGIEASEGNVFELSSWHDDVCGVCHEKKSCTEPRDFYYPDFKGKSK